MAKLHQGRSSTPRSADLTNGSFTVKDVTPTPGLTMGMLVEDYSDPSYLPACTTMKTIVPLQTLTTGH